MQRALEEGKRYDQEMTQLAESEINPAMMSAGDEGEGDEEADEDEGGRKGNGGSSKRSGGKKK